VAIPSPSSRTAHPSLDENYEDDAEAGIFWGPPTEPNGEPIRWSRRLKDAAVVIADNPIALQLRYLQTLLELGSSQARTIVFPAPIDLLSPLLKKRNGGGASS
jgi:hypothetical protein